MAHNLKWPSGITKSDMRYSINNRSIQDSNRFGSCNTNQGNVRSDEQRVDTFVQLITKLRK